MLERLGIREVFFRMPRTKRRKTHPEPMYLLVVRALSRAGAWSAVRARGFWHDLTMAKGARYFRALALFCVICVLVGMAASLVARSATLRLAVERYRAVFLGAGGTTTPESGPPQTSSATPEAPASPPAATPGPAATPPTATPAGASPSPAAVPASAGTASPALTTRPALEEIARPVTGPLLTGFGWQYSVTLADWRHHPGVDLQAAEGSAARAALGGRVAATGASFERGIFAVIDHGGGVKTVYGSLADLLVKTGDAVAAGQEVGKVSTTAEAEVALGPHLHFELQDGATALDPTPYWP
jgi:murein DD-endopeptidase MepM/ murein hydrolase activator NlpD